MRRLSHTGETGTVEIMTTRKSRPVAWGVSLTILAAARALSLVDAAHFGLFRLDRRRLSETEILERAASIPTHTLFTPASL